MKVTLNYFNNAMGRWFCYECDSTILSVKEQKKLDRLVQESNFFSTERSESSYGDGRGAKYDITIEGTSKHTFKTKAVDLPDEMLPLVEFVINQRFTVTNLSRSDEAKSGAGSSRY